MALISLMFIEIINFSACCIRFYKLCRDMSFFIYAFIGIYSRSFFYEYFKDVSILSRL